MGTVSLNGEVIFDAAEPDIGDAAKRRQRLHFGLVFQQFNLFPQYTVLKNVTLARELLAKEEIKKSGLSRAECKEKIAQTFAEIEKNARALLHTVGLDDKVDSYPCMLSGGQQQRVAIARALCLEPDILCFDEPTSALDPELTGEVLRVIRELRDGNTTMIIVTHEMNFARDVANRVVFMDKGIILEE